MEQKMIYCRDCDYPLWRLEDQQSKFCPDCRGDEQEDSRDLEDSLDELFGED